MQLHQPILVRDVRDKFTARLLDSLHRHVPEIQRTSNDARSSCE
jgi:hypothetical protein